MSLEAERKDMTKPKHTKRPKTSGPAVGSSDLVRLLTHRGIGDARSAALNLCYEIENLPNSQQQTKVIELAAALLQRLNDLLP